MDIIQKIKAFLLESSDYYSDLCQRKKRDMEIYSGSFWSDKEVDACDRKGRINKEWSQYFKYTNAITSPFTKSPYHAEIDNASGMYGEIQQKLDDIENNSNTKYIFQQALRNAVVTGVGYFLLSTDNGKVLPEIVKDINMVALDPNIQELDGSDAECGAIVNYINIKKAKRLYGNDVVNYDNSSALSFIGSQWNTPTNSVAIVSYYEMNENNTVDLYTVCGNKEIKEKVTLNISRIPIFRICFDEVIRNNKFDYRGIVDLTAGLQFGMNLGYSTLLERANRSPKANFLMPAKAMDGLDEFYKRLHTKESLVCLYNGDVAPTPIIEQFQTNDLMNTITTCSNLMSETIGIPQGGIAPQSNNVTATEVLVQQANSESNVNSIYENANNAIFSFNQTVIELLCWESNIEKLPTFRLINGPTVITKLMKRRQELLAVSSMVDDKSRKIIAKQYIETLDKELSEPLLADIIANSPDIMFVSDSNQNEDPRAVATLQNMNAQLEETMNELENQVQLNNDLKNQIDQLNLQLLNQKQQQILDYQKHIDDLNIRQQEINLKVAEAEAKNVMDIEDNRCKNAIEETKLQKELISLEKQKLDIVKDATNV